MRSLAEQSEQKKFRINTHPRILPPFLPKVGEEGVVDVEAINALSRPEIIATAVVPFIREQEEGRAFFEVEEVKEELKDHFSPVLVLPELMPILTHFLWLKELIALIVSRNIREAIADEAIWQQLMLSNIGPADAHRRQLKEN